MALLHTFCVVANAGGSSTPAFSFGGASTAAGGAGAAPAFSFGASSSGAGAGGLSAPAAPGAPASTGGLSFGGASSAAAAPSGGFSFGASSAAAVTAAAPASKPAFGATGGFSFGASSAAATTAVATTAAATTAAAPAASAGAFSFGAAPSSSTPAAAPATSTGLSFGAASSAAATTPAPSTSLSFGAPASTPAAALTTTAAPTTAGALTATTTTTTTTTQTEITAPSTIKGQVIGDIINEWTMELEKRSRAFVKHAEELAKWDTSILENRQALIQLEEELKRVLAGQDALERRLQMVEAHQKGIHEALNGMSTEAERLYREEQGLADDQAMERDALYERTSRLGTTLSQIGEQLGEAIQDVNSVNVASGEAADTSVSKLVRILNNQLNSLVQLESKTGELQALVNNRSL